MVVDPISSKEVMPTPFELMSGAVPPPPAPKDAPLDAVGYYKDTITEEVRTKEEINPLVRGEEPPLVQPEVTRPVDDDPIDIEDPDTFSISNFCSWIWNFITGTSSSSESKEVAAKENSDETVDQVTSRPTLEAPAEVDRRSMEKFIVEMNQLNDRLKSISEEEVDAVTKDLNQSEAAMFQLLIRAVKNQRELLEAVNLHDKDRMMALHEENKKIQQEYFQLKEQMESRVKASNVLGWVSGIMTGVFIIGSIAAAVATGGASIAFTAAKGLAAITGGGSVLGKGVLDYKSSKDQGEIYVLGENRQRNSTKIQTELKLLTETLDAVLRTWSDLREIVRNQSEAAREFTRVN